MRSLHCKFVRRGYKGITGESCDFSPTFLSNPGGALKPVPTAVPPKARWYTSFILESKRSKSSSNKPTYPENSCPNERGVASCIWVRPTFTISFHCRALACNESRKCLTDGINR